MQDLICGNCSSNVEPCIYCNIEFSTEVHFKLKFTFAHRIGSNLEKNCKIRM